MKLLKKWWRGTQDYAHRHQKQFRHAHHWCHLSYFSLVWLHGPYQFVAAALLILGVVAWIFHLEE